MDDLNGHEVEPVEQRLRAERGELSGIELDRIKTGVLAKAARQGGRGMNLRSRLVTGLLMLGLVGTGGGAVLAASGGSSSKGSSANSQYCPPSSPGGGNPKHQGKGNKCGHPKCEKGGKGHPKHKDKDHDGDKCKDNDGDGD
jgi:hypothetical protein